MIANEGIGKNMTLMMSRAQQATCTVGHRSGSLLTSLATLLVAVLLVLPHRVEAIPFVGADFQRFDGLLFAGHQKSLAKVHMTNKVHKARKQYGKLTKKRPVSRPTRSRRSAFAREWVRNTANNSAISGASLWLSSSASGAVFSWWSPADVETPIAEQDLVEAGDEFDPADEFSDESYADVSLVEITANPIPAPALIDLPSDFVSASDLTGGQEIITELGDDLTSPVISDPEFDGSPPPPFAQQRAVRPVPEPSTMILVGLAVLGSRRLPRTVHRRVRRG